MKHRMLVVKEKDSESLMGIFTNIGEVIKCLGMGGSFIEKYDLYSAFVDSDTNIRTDEFQIITLKDMCDHYNCIPEEDRQ